MSKETSDGIIFPQQSQPTPVYEDVLPKSTQDHWEPDFHDLELKKNVAYGPAQPT